MQTTYNDSSLTTSFTIRHDYEEVLDDQGIFEGWIDIVFLRDPSIRKHDVLTASNLVYAPGYNPQTRNLTFDPKDSIRLEYTWDLRDDLGRILIGTGEAVPPVFRFKRDSTCPSRLIADAEQFGVTGQILVFEKTGGPVFPARIFNLCFVAHTLLDSTRPNPPCTVPLALGKKCLN
ncbi:MAG: hypothetical protein WBD36_12005 [Bacteroidota bacterium]